MAPQFGERVQGRENFLRAVRNEEGGADVFGTRVRGAIPDTPSHGAKRASEFGGRVVRGAKASDREGNETDSISIDELRNTLAENPTFFDSLFEAELARADEPREEALRIFLQHEQGIKGQGRPDILSDINAMLGVGSTTAENTADRQERLADVYDGMAERTAENVKLRDAGRLRSLRQRDEDLKEVSKASSESTKRQALTTDGQANDAAGEPKQQRAATDPNATARPEGPVRPETQQPGPRGADSPKGAGRDEGKANDQNDGEGDESRTQDEGDEASDPEALTVAELREELSEEQYGKIKGSGADGAVLKADLVKAVKKARKEK